MQIEQLLADFLNLSWTISIGDLIIIMLLMVLIKRIKYPFKEFLQQVFAESTWIIPFLPYLNDTGSVARISAEILKEMINDNLIDKETAVRILANQIAKNRYVLSKVFAGELKESKK